MLLNEYKRNFFRLLNEGAAEMYRDSYYPEVDDYILEKIIEIDPESNGDDLSEPAGWAAAGGCGSVFGCWGF